jgi:DNA-binding NarL/FixJ family response regulator
MDIRMPNLDGIEATRRIAAGNGAPRILILTTFDLDDYVYEALRAGASGFPLKDARAEELRQAVRMFASGDALLSPAFTRRLIESYTRRPPPTMHPTPPRRVDATRARGAAARSARVVKRRHRPRARRRRRDGQNARCTHLFQA